MNYCPDCDQQAVVEEEPAPHQFEFGRVPDQVILTAVHPVFKCNHCGYQFADWRGEDAQELAVSIYLSAMINDTINELGDTK